MSFKYNAKFTSIEMIAEFPTAREGVKLVLSALHGRYASHELYDLRIYRDDKPAFSGIYISEYNMRKLVKYMSERFDNAAAADIETLLGYDPFEG